MLRGALGGAAVSVGLPPLEAMFNAHGDAMAQGGAIPRRLGVFFWGNGVKLDRWTPKDTGATWTPSPALEPLAPLKDYVSVVSGMNIKTGNQRGHHAGCVGILSGAPMVEQPHPNSNYVSTFSKPSIDQVAAAAIGQTTRFKSIEVGISKRVVKGEGTTLWYLSHNGPDSPNPPEYDPNALFNRIFGGDFKAPDSTAPTVVDATRALRQSVLDAVRADVMGLQTKVSASDKLRLQQHLDNIRTIENRLKEAPPLIQAGCKLPVNPGTITDTSSKEQLELKVKAMSDLLAMAVACDQTRVFSMMFSGSVGSTVFWQVNATKGHHDLSHDEAGDQPLVHASTVFTMQMFGLLMTSLKNIQEGAGNLLDNTVLIGSSDCADGKAHSINDYPIVIGGKGGGALKHPGVHYRSAGENASMALLTVLRAAGVELTEFGTAGGRVTQGCSAIEV
jgi:hypothetical protein